VTRDAVRSGAAFGAVALVTALYAEVLHVTNGTTVALTFLLVVLVAAATSRLWIAVATSFAASACFNYFFLPPVGTLRIADPENLVALFTFLAVSLVASHLSSSARARAQEALLRRDELTRLFDFSRDVLLVSGSADAAAQLARCIARRFDLDYAAIAVPSEEGWSIAEAGRLHLDLDPSMLGPMLSTPHDAVEFDARDGTYSGHRTLAVGPHAVRIVPLRVGTRPLGILAAAGRPVEPGSLDALGGVVAIAIERIQLLEERKAADLARQKEELQSALLASLGHDLRTPLTAIRIAASNLQASWLSDADRREQADLVLAETERLTRLFDDILDMARIDTGAESVRLAWVQPSQIIDAAREQVGRTLRHRRLDISIDSDTLVRLDPRLTASALAQLFENAARYSPPDTGIEVGARLADDELVIAVRDHGPGIAPADLPRLFDRFYQGAGGRRAGGTGMGLSIARGLLAVERGRVWAENGAGGGARFTMAVPVEEAALKDAAPASR